MHFEKADMRTMRDLSPRLSSASVIAPPRFYSQSKEGVHDCAKSRIENRERNAQHLPSFLFFSPSFSENNATHRPVSRKGNTKNFGDGANALAKNCIRPLPLRKNTRRKNLPTPVMHTADRRTCVHSPTLSRFVRTQKKQLPIFRWIAV